MQFYKTNLSCEAIRTEHSDQTFDFFNQVANQINTIFSPVSVLDIGSGNGLLVAALKKIGIQAIAGNPLDMISESNQRYDLITCIEVLQCLSPDDGELAIETMCSLTDQVLISSNPDRFTEENHINTMPVENWSVIFARHGFFRDQSTNSVTTPRWATIYRRIKVEINTIIHSYENALSRRDQEIQQLRVFNQNLQEQNQHGYAATKDPELLYQENLRLRDALMGAEATRDELLSFGIAARRLERIERSIPWRIMKPFRALRNWLGYLKNKLN